MSSDDNPQPHVMYKNFVKFEHVVFEVCQLKDRQTYRHTVCNTAPLLGAK